MCSRCRSPRERQSSLQLFHLESTGQQALALEWQSAWDRCGQPSTAWERPTLCLGTRSLLGKQCRLKVRQASMFQLRRWSRRCRPGIGVQERKAGRQQLQLSSEFQQGSLRQRLLQLRPSGSLLRRPCSLLTPWYPDMNLEGS